MMPIKQPADFARAFAAALVFVAACFVSHARVCGQQAAPSPAPAQEAQNPADNTDGAQRTADTERQPDISLTGRVTARELRFNVVPNPKVEFPGRPRRETVWEADRENLPPAVRPGETYRNIGITLRITSVFADIDRIVAEALGEVPLSDDAPRDQPTPPEPPPQQQVTPPSSSSPPALETSPAADARTTGRATRRTNATRTNAARRGNRR